MAAVLTEGGIGQPLAPMAWVAGAARGEAC